MERRDLLKLFPAALLGPALLDAAPVTPPVRNRGPLTPAQLAVTDLDGPLLHLQYCPEAAHPGESFQYVRVHRPCELVWDVGATEPHWKPAAGPLRVLVTDQEAWALYALVFGTLNRAAKEMPAAAPLDDRIAL